ncbi:hypothetical protein [Sneathiella sp.]|uniref:CC0125/CC1285 family lipoprotein n=1 Tax=Sneathiella sp. TaxID=1964365 RepID=UPI00263404E0|nr:hypothetical protein [Sneathiella sp.]MDF2366316.1 hypothetical protein [Sneathiella sp.]
MRYLAITVLAALLTACTAPYGSDSIWFNGYKDQRLSEDRYMISTETSALIDINRANQFNLRRAAEVTIQSGYTHFAIIDEDKNETVTQRTVPGTVVSNTYGSAYGYGTGAQYGSVYNYSGSAYGSSNTSTTYTPPRTVTRKKSNPTITIIMLRNPKEQAPNIFIARDVLMYTKDL